MTDKVDSHTSGTLSDVDRIVVTSVPPGGNWRDLPDDFPSQRVRQIRHGAANGGGSRSTYYGRLRNDRPMTLCQPCVLDALTAEGEQLGHYWEIET